MGSANSKLRGLVAYNQSVERSDAQIGDTAPFYKATNRKSAPHRRGPAKISDVDEAGGARGSSLIPCGSARRCVRRKVGGGDVGLGSL